MASLRWLRGINSDSDDDGLSGEMETIKTDIKNKSEAENVTLGDFVSSWRPILLCLGMMFLSQWSGLNVLVYYSVTIFQMTTATGSIQASVASVYTGLALLVSCLIAIALTSR